VVGAATQRARRDLGAVGGDRYRAAEALRLAAQRLADLARALRGALRDLERALDLGGEGGADLVDAQARALGGEDELAAGGGKGIADRCGRGGTALVHGGELVELPAQRLGDVAPALLCERGGVAHRLRLGGEHGLDAVDPRGELRGAALELLGVPAQRRHDLHDAHRRLVRRRREVAGVAGEREAAVVEARGCGVAGLREEPRLLPQGRGERSGAPAGRALVGGERGKLRAQRRRDAAHLVAARDEGDREPQRGKRAGDPDDDQRLLVRA